MNAIIQNELTCLASLQIASPPSRSPSPGPFLNGL